MDSFSKIPTKCGRPLFAWPVRFKHTIKSRLILVKSALLNERETLSVRKTHRREEIIVTTNNQSSNEMSSNFGLITARLGLLLSRLTTGIEVREEDRKLLEEGRNYLLNISKLAQILKSGGAINELVPHLNFLSLVMNNPKSQLAQLDNSEIINQRAEDIQKILNKETVDQNRKKELADLFLAISRWNSENESAKHFAGNNSKGFRLLF